MARFNVGDKVAGFSRYLQQYIKGTVVGIRENHIQKYLVKIDFFKSNNFAYLGHNGGSNIEGVVFLNDQIPVGNECIWLTEDEVPLPDKTADEMFAELGYSYQYEMGGFGYVGHQYKWKQPCNGAEKILLFNDIDKELQVHNETDYHLSPNEIKAIHKKLEEQGWL